MRQIRYPTGDSARYPEYVIRLLIRTAIFLASSAIGLLVAALILDDFKVTAGGFLLVVVIFAVLQSVLTPFLLKVVARNAPAFVGGIGLLSTFVALLVATVVGDSLEISGVGTWVLGSLIVWLATAVATMLLPLALLRGGVEAAQRRASQA